MRAGASLSPLVGTGSRVATADLVVPAPARRHSPPCSNQWGERCARDVTENPSASVSTPLRQWLIGSIYSLQLKYGGHVIYCLQYFLIQSVRCIHPCRSNCRFAIM